MRGHIDKVRRSAARAHADYLADDVRSDLSMAGYYEGAMLSRYVGGRRVASGPASREGLAWLLSGRDVRDGATLREIRSDGMGAYGFPINDTKSLDVAAVLWEDVRGARVAAQERGEAALKDYLAKTLVVRLSDGHGGRRWVTPDEIAFASVQHFTSRAGDPHTHRHLLLANTVRVGGSWYAVDSVRLFGMYENLRSVYETAVYGDPELRAALARHGADLHMDGSIPRLDEVAAVFSKRRDQVEARLAVLVSEWASRARRGLVLEDMEGRPVGVAGRPDIPADLDVKAMQRLYPQAFSRLARRAWDETRAKKSAATTRLDWDYWRAEIVRAGFSPAMMGGGPVREALPAVGVDRATLERMAVRAVAALGVAGSAWSRRQAEVAAYDQIRAWNVMGTPGQISALAGRLTAAIVERCEPISQDPRGRLPWMKSLTSRQVIDTEMALRGRLAARGLEDGGPTPDVAALATRLGLDGGQAAALALIAKGVPLAVVEGVAGSGKTYMLAAARQWLEEHGGRMMVLAPTVKASKEAAASTGAQARTIMALLTAHGWRRDEERGWWREKPATVADRWRLDRSTTIVVDESGMVPQDQMLALLTLADEAGARVVLTGDRRQLQAVGRGGVLQLATHYTDAVVTMRQAHRFKDPAYADLMGRLHDRSSGTAAGLAGELMARPGMVTRCSSEEEAIQAIAAAYMTDRRTAVTTATNASTDAINAAIQQKRLAAGELGDIAIPDMREGESIHVGDVVMTRAGDRAAGVANREVHTVVGIDREGVTVRGEDGRDRRLTHAYVRESLQLGYAATTHGAQGITAPRAIHYATAGADGESLYVGATRGKAENLLFLVAADDAEAERVLTGVIRREGGDTGLEAARAGLEAQMAEASTTPPVVEAARETLERATAAAIDRLMPRARRDAEALATLTQRTREDTAELAEARAERDQAARRPLGLGRRQVRQLDERISRLQAHRAGLEDQTARIAARWRLDPAEAAAFVDTLDGGRAPAITVTGGDGPTPPQAPTSAVAPQVPDAVKALAEDDPAVRAARRALAHAIAHPTPPPPAPAPIHGPTPEKPRESPREAADGREASRTPPERRGPRTTPRRQEPAPAPVTVAEPAEDPATWWDPATTGPDGIPITGADPTGLGLATPGVPGAATL